MQKKRRLARPLSFNLETNHRTLLLRFFCHTSPTEGPCYRTPAVPSRSAGVSIWPAPLPEQLSPTDNATGRLQLGEHQDGLPGKTTTRVPNFTLGRPPDGEVSDAAFA
jgi:hypothetical protein